MLVLTTSLPIHHSWYCCLCFTSAPAFRVTHDPNTRFLAPTSHVENAATSAPAPFHPVSRAFFHSRHPQAGPPTHGCQILHTCRTVPSVASELVKNGKSRVGPC
jgi:hypothetical protein